MRTGEFKWPLPPSSTARLTEPREDGPRDDAVSNIQLGHAGDPGDIGHIAVIEPMTACRPCPAASPRPGLDQRRQFAGDLGGVRRVGIAAGVQLDGRTPGWPRPRPARRWSMNRLTSSPASRQRATASPTLDRCPTTSRPPRSSTPPAVGYERDLVRPEFEGNRHDRRFHGQFQVEAALHCLNKEAQVAVLDVATVLAEMDSDSIAPPSSASLAAQTGSGSRPPRAWRSVATWSIFTPDEAFHDFPKQSL